MPVTVEADVDLRYRAYSGKIVIRYDHEDTVDVIPLQHYIEKHVDKGYILAHAELVHIYIFDEMEREYTWYMTHIFRVKRY